MVDEMSFIERTLINKWKGNKFELSHERSVKSFNCEMNRTRTILMSFFVWKSLAIQHAEIYQHQLLLQLYIPQFLFNKCRTVTRLDTKCIYIYVPVDLVVYQIGSWTISERNFMIYKRENVEVTCTQTRRKANVLASSDNTQRFEIEHSLLCNFNHST